MICSAVKTKKENAISVNGKGCTSQKIMLLTVKYFQQNNFACNFNNPNILTCHKPLPTNENENTKRTTMRKLGKFKFV